MWSAVRSMSVIQYISISELLPDLMNSAIIVLDNQHLVTLWNRQAEKFYGIERTQALGQQIHHILPCSLLPDMTPEDIQDTINLHQNLHQRVTHFNIHGHILYLDLHLHALPDDSGCIIIMNDISSNVKQEYERQRFECQIQLTQKLESLGLLAGTIVHDFNNILANILGNAEIAMMDTMQHSDAMKHLQDIKSTALQASELCNQMLAYSGKSRSIIKHHNLNQIIKDTNDLVKVSVSSKAELHFNLHEHLSAIEADSAQIRQVLLNLITNAKEAITGHDGCITISTGVIVAGTSDLTSQFPHDPLQPGRYVYLEVEDNGSGMSKETQEKIFDPFYTTKSTGRGLGLAAVLGIVKAHHGLLKLKSEVGKGTIFRVLFPAVDKEIDMISSVEMEKTMTDDDKTGTILLVDDEASVRDVFRIMLSRKGFTVLTARDGREAIECFEEQSSTISVVILDLCMPRMSGEEVFPELLRIRKDIPIILSSGYGKETMNFDFDGIQPAGFLQKPYVFKKMMTLLNGVIN